MRSDPATPDKLVEARRRFLASCGKFALATPPVVTLMLADAERNYAVAGSGGGGHHHRGHHGGHHHGRHGGHHGGRH